MPAFVCRQEHRMLIVISSPSGGGKTTVVHALLELDAALAHSVSTTSRPWRPAEIEGKAYHFVAREQFRRMIEQNQFLEWAEVHGNLYGTRRDVVQPLLDSGRDVLLSIDVQGAVSVRRQVPDAVLIFLAPPSLEALEQRLRRRGQDSEEAIARRMRNAPEEILAAERFDYVIINDRLDEAITTVQAIIAAERCRASRCALGGDVQWLRDHASARAQAEAFAPAIVQTRQSMADVLARAQRVARTDSPVLLLGETGTGKELLAEAVHRAGPRATGPLVRVNCGAIPPTLLESELFGHVAGAFTGAVRDNPGLFRTADHGTIFLDEIAEMPPDLQVKLLRVLENGELRPVGGTETGHVDVRVIAATNRDLEAAVAAGRFRRDLFYRLNVVTLRLPPLRERPEDIPALVSHFLRRLAAQGHPMKSIRPEAMDLLLAFDWPGNVRQLENAVEHAVVLSRSQQIGIEDLPENLRQAAAGTQAAVPPVAGGVSLRDLEMVAIRKALDEAGNNLTRAARQLGITRRALTYRLDKYGISLERHRGRPRREARS